MDGIDRPSQYQFSRRNPTRSYRIQEFAQLAGTTVRALQHYDRLGLLSPPRTGAGARIYSTADLEALVQIMALKSVGLRLKRIGLLRGAGPLAVAEALESERRALEQKQPEIDRAIFAIRNVEAALGRGEDADPAVLKPLMAALRSDRAGGAQDAGVPPEPSPAWDELREEWQQLLIDIEQADEVDPGGPELQELATRWDRLMARSTGGGSYRAAFMQSAAALDLAASMPRTPGERIFAKVGGALKRMVPSAAEGANRGDDSGDGV